MRIETLSVCLLVPALAGCPPSFPPPGDESSGDAGRIFDESVADISDEGIENPEVDSGERDVFVSECLNNNECVVSQYCRCSGNELLCEGVLAICEDGRCKTFSNQEICSFGCSENESRCLVENECIVKEDCIAAESCECEGNQSVCSQKTGRCIDSECEVTESVEECEHGCEAGACLPQCVENDDCVLELQCHCDEMKSVCNGILPFCDNGNCQPHEESIDCQYGCLLGECLPEVECQSGEECPISTDCGCEDFFRVCWTKTGQCNDNQCERINDVNEDCVFGCSDGECLEECYEDNDCVDREICDCGENFKICAGKLPQCENNHCAEFSLREECDFGCEFGECLPECLENDDCVIRSECVCEGTTNVCVNTLRICDNGFCESHSDFFECEFGCAAGECLPEVECRVAEDCEISTVCDCDENGVVCLEIMGICRDNHCERVENREDCEYGCEEGHCLPQCSVNEDCIVLENCECSGQMNVCSGQLAECENNFCKEFSREEECISGCQDGECLSEIECRIDHDCQIFIDCGCNESNRVCWQGNGICSENHCEILEEREDCEFGCESGECRLECYSNNDCEALEICECRGSMKVCSGQLAECENNVCKEFSGEEECFFGCEIGECLPEVECRVDQNCVVSTDCDCDDSARVCRSVIESCVDNYCVRDESREECEFGCEFGECRLECSLNNDCEALEICECLGQMKVCSGQLAECENNVCKEFSGEEECVYGCEADECLPQCRVNIDCPESSSCRCEDQSQVCEIKAAICENGFCSERVERNICPRSCADGSCVECSVAIDCAQSTSCDCDGDERVCTVTTGHCMDHQCESREGREICPFGCQESACRPECVIDNDCEENILCHCEGNQRICAGTLASCENLHCQEMTSTEVCEFQCEEGECEPECRVDDDCPAESDCVCDGNTQICSGSSGVCEDNVCQDFQDVNVCEDFCHGGDCVECLADNDCPFMQFCQNNSCQYDATRIICRFNFNCVPEGIRMVVWTGPDAVEEAQVCQGNQFEYLLPQVCSEGNQFPRFRINTRTQQGYSGIGNMQIECNNPNFSVVVEDDRDYPSGTRRVEFSTPGCN
ncbi:hypothetical protein KKC32_00675 [Patescibacteria group bacterium]|nr:hypothetical protein [Patescibacteria group bacterium]